MATIEPMASSVDITEETVEAQVSAWVDENWNPDLTLGEWWQRLADSGYCHPSLPTEAGGKGWGQALALRVMRVLADKKVVGPPPGLGYMLAAPTIAEHGTPEQIERYVPQILNGRQAWCQLFSEPGARSDLAGLACNGVRGGGHCPAAVAVGCRGRAYRPDRQHAFCLAADLSAGARRGAADGPDAPARNGKTDPQEVARQG